MKNKILASMREEASEFMETNKKWWHNLNFRHPWMEGLVVYGSIFLVCILVLYGIFAKANIFQGTDANSARYMLSALVQSQAAIVAIVIILTQVAIQVTSSYSAREKFNIFRNNPAMEILLLLYGLSIFYGLIILRLVKGGDDNTISQSFELFVSIALILGVFTYIALFLYMRYFFDSLKPENRIERLLKNVTKNKILNYIKVEPSKIGTNYDPVQPIMDIIHGSIEIHDHEITRTGLNKIVKQAIKIITPLEMVEKEILLRYFYCHLQQVGIFAAGIAEEESTVEIIENLEQLWDQLWLG